MNNFNIRKEIDNLLIKTKLDKYKDILWFITIIVVMHIAWKLWAHYFDYKLFGYDVLYSATHFTLNHLRLQSVWLLNHWFGTEAVIKGEFIYFSDYSKMGVTWGCSALKQFYQFTGIILLFYGPWKHKLWYIPMGIVVLYIVNLIRITGLSFIVIYKLEWFNPIHDWVVRPFFYVVMFFLWVWWIEKWAKKKVATT